MIINLRGVRGSIPVPGKDTVKYGGNTTCIEITTDEGDKIIIDGGSGIRPLGNELMKQLPVSCSIFITHTHWDPYSRATIFPAAIRAWQQHRYIWIV